MSRYILFLLMPLLVLGCSSGPGVKTQRTYADFQGNFISEHSSGVKEVQCMVDFESPMLGFQDNFAYVKVSRQTEKKSGCNLDFQSDRDDEQWQASQATLQFACWLTSFSGFANLFDYAAIDKLTIRETEEEYIFKDGQVNVSFVKDLSVADVNFTKDNIRIAIEYKAPENNHKRRWNKAVMTAQVPDQEFQIESRIEPTYGEDLSWPEKIKVTSLGMETMIQFRDCKKIR